MTSIIYVVWKYIYCHQDSCFTFVFSFSLQKHASEIGQMYFCVWPQHYSCATDHHAGVDFGSFSGNSKVWQCIMYQSTYCTLSFSGFHCPTSRFLQLHCIWLEQKWIQACPWGLHCSKSIIWLLFDELVRGTCIWASYQVLAMYTMHGPGWGEEKCSSVNTVC